MRSIGHVSLETADKLKKVCWTLKESFDVFAECYNDAFIDCCGENWRKDVFEDGDFAEIVATVEEEVKAICIEAGMLKSVWTRMCHGCRNVAFYGIPFKFKNCNIKDIQRAKKIAASSIDDVSEETKVIRALQFIREENQTTWSANSTIKGGNTVLKLPKDGVDPIKYKEQIFSAIVGFLSHQKVKAIIGKDRIVEAIRSLAESSLKTP